MNEGESNAILSLEEKHGGSQYISQAMTNFRNWISKDNLVDFAPRNGLYMWHNKRKEFCQIEE